MMKAKEVVRIGRSRAASYRFQPPLTDSAAPA